jgi:D-alanyl-D-alanine carboxypeptidase
MKTGYTDKSKHCLITSGSYGGHDAITVILGTPDRSQLFRDSAALLAWALGLHVLPVTILKHAAPPSTEEPATPHHSRRHHKKHVPTGDVSS